MHLPLQSRFKAFCGSIDTIHASLTLMKIRACSTMHFSFRQCAKDFCGFSMGRNQYWAGRVYDLCVLLYDGNSRRLNRKWFYGEAGNWTCDPWFTRHSAYPLHHGGSVLKIYTSIITHYGIMASYIISYKIKFKMLEVTSSRFQGDSLKFW